MASTIKVDNVQNQPGTNIISKCSTTITIGASSDTIALACGASQTGFGRTGTVDWITTPKTTTFSAVSGEGYFCNTSGGVITVNLPAGAAGSIVSLADYAATWQTNNVTVIPNGTEKIGGTNANATLNTQGQSVTFVYVDSTQGWVNTMDSTSNVRGSSFILATVSGACNTLVTAPDCANTKIATFLGPGSLCVSAAASCATNNVVSYMVAAGGGGGGYAFGGGGGGGGFREYKSPVTPYTASPLDGNPGGTAITIAASPYPITVGGGGPGGPNSTPTSGTAGSDSIFSSITSTGGGFGGKNGASIPGGVGGSGGGGGSFGNPLNPGGAGNTPSVSPAQGFAGGIGSAGPPDPGFQKGGGGGGATGVGTPVDPDGSVKANGGVGATSSISASPLGRSGGGGGGASAGPPVISGDGSSCGSGGNGSGPAVGCSPAAAVNRGGGGGGGGPSQAGAAGGSGIVIIRYKFQ